MKEKTQMSIKEANRLSVMKQIDKKILNIRKASEELGLSLRQTKRVRKRYLEEAEKGLISRKRGKPGNRKIKSQVRDKVVVLLKTKYLGFGPTLAGEKLQELDKIQLSAETLRLWMIEENLWASKRKKEQRVYQRRMRRGRFGELLQGDGSPHDWFEGRDKKCTLLQFVDDATGITTAARFMPVETTDGYLFLLEEHLKKYGRPLGLYVDKHSVFRVSRDEFNKGIGITHFGKVARDLEIELICAHSPQAKGRVERKNGVFQDRLIKEMRLRGINTLEEGNAFLPFFLEEINRRFGREAANPEDAHRPLRKQDDLKRIFLRRDKRKLSNNLTFQHKGVLYLVQTKSPNRLKHATVEVLWTEGGSIKIEYNGTELEFKKWSETVYEQPKILDTKEIMSETWVTKKKPKPSKHHPWR